MSKPLLGGGAAAAVAVLSASLLFYAQPSVAEALAVASQDSHQTGATQQQEVTTPRPETADGDETGAKLKEESSRVENAGPVAPADAAVVESPSRQFTATAYALRGRTASGRPVARGIIAADRRVLPIGTRVRIEAGAYSGEYLVADTGGLVRGRKIDIWVPSTREAMRFGRRSVKLTVLTRTRPRATTPARPRRAGSTTE